MESIENKEASECWKNLNLADLYKCPLFFGELSEEDAKEILVEAKKNDKNSDGKIILFSKTVFDEIKKNHFTIVSGHLLEHDINGEPMEDGGVDATVIHGRQHQFYFFEDDWYTAICSVWEPFKNLIMRKYPFSLEELAKTKIAISGVNPETLGLPKRFEDEVKKYQALNERLIQSPLLQLDSSPLTPDPFDNENSDITILTPDPQIISVARRAEWEAENQTLKTQLTIKIEDNKTLARQVEDMRSSYSLARQKSVNFEESRDK